MWEACENGDLSAAITAASAGASVNEPNPRNGWIPLHFACQKNHFDVVHWLLNHGAAASINTRTPSACEEEDDGWAPLHFAVDTGNVHLVDLLLRMGAKVDLHAGDRSTPLMIAAEQGYDDIVQRLISQRAKLDLRGPEGMTALYRSILVLGRPGTAQLLLKHGANPDIANRTFGTTALMTAASSSNLEIVKLLIDKGAAINAADRSGMTALHWCAFKGGVDVANTLIKSGADTKLKDKEGKSALDWARSCRNASVQSVLED